MLHLILVGFLTTVSFITKTRQNFVDPQTIETAETICMLDMTDPELNPHSDTDSELLEDEEKDGVCFPPEHSNNNPRAPHRKYGSSMGIPANLCSTIMWISPKKMNIPVVHGDLEHSTFEYRYRPETPKLKPGISKQAAIKATKRFNLRQEILAWSDILAQYFGSENGPFQYFGYKSAKEMGERLREASVMILDDQMSRKILTENVTEMLESLSDPLPRCFDPAGELVKGSREWNRRVEKDTNAMVKYLYNISCIAYPSKHKDTSKKAEAVAKMARQIFERKF